MSHAKNTGNPFYVFPIEYKLKIGFKGYKRMFHAKNT